MLAPKRAISKESFARPRVHSKAMRATVPSLLAAALLGCGAPAVVEHGAVAIRPPRDGGDSALVLSYPATLCTVTLRDENERLYDLEDRIESTARVDMTRAVPNNPWSIIGGAPAALLTVLAMPPGRYTVTAYSTSDDWDELAPDDRGPRARTDCTGALETHATHLPLRIERGKLTLLDLPKGAVDYPELRTVSFALHNPYVTSTVGPWLPRIRQTGSAMHRELAARQRQRRDGYDLYPHCDGKVAVVRKAGKPFEWYGRPDDEAARRRFRHETAPLPGRSIHATGFGSGCVEPRAFVYLLTDPAELEPLSRALGEMMVREDLAGEIDLVVTGIPSPEPRATPRAGRRSRRPRRRRSRRRSRRAPSRSV
jgi:hypothetical protein